MRIVFKRESWIYKTGYIVLFLLLLGVVLYLYNCNDCLNKNLDISVGIIFFIIGLVAILVRKIFCDMIVLIYLIGVIVYYFI
jgi:hypothetical protein